MQTTTAQREKDADSELNTKCDNDWCDGPDSDTLPCFACFESEREYEDLTLASETIADNGDR